MNHRHLLPDELDLLLDGEVGFGVAPLRAHVRQCAQCQTELEETRAVCASLEHLPHLSPSPLFAERVMEQVPVFQPWHVAAREAVERLPTRSGPARVFAGAMAAAVAVVLSVLTVWLVSRADVLLFLSAMALERGRALALSGLRELLIGILGRPALDLVAANGTAGLLIAALALLAMTVAVAAGLRALAVSAAGQRS